MEEDIKRRWIHVTSPYLKPPPAETPQKNDVVEEGSEEFPLNSFRSSTVISFIFVFGRMICEFSGTAVILRVSIFPFVDWLFRVDRYLIWVEIDG